MNGQGIIGVRVSVARTKDSTNYGFTLTRPGGWWVIVIILSSYLSLLYSDNIVDIFCKYMNYNRFIKLHIYWLIREPFSHFTQFLFKLFFFTIVDTFCNRVQMFIELINTIRCDWTCHTLSILFKLLKLANSIL